MPKTILRVENISKSFPGVKALQKVSFDVEEGEVHVLLGENGAGKSTLIKILTGVHIPDEGEIYLKGEKVSPTNPLESRALGIGTVFQENSLVPHLTVAENIFLSKEVRGKIGNIDWKKTYKECEKWFQELGVNLNPKQKVNKISVADQQIVEIIKTFSMNPTLIILDEPTSSLMDAEIDHLFEIIRKMRDKGVTFIYISHRMEEIKRIGDRCSVLRDGCVVKTGIDAKNTETDELIKLIVGRELKEKFPSRVPQIGDTVMEVNGVTIPELIYDINFSVRQGEVLGFAGLVGSGRTSTARAVFGAVRKSSGKIKISGKEVKIDSPRDAIKNGIAFLPEDRKVEGLILSKSIRENISLPSLAVKFRKMGILNKKLEKSAVKDYKERLTIKTPDIEQFVKLLSGGNQQKVVFAKWLCADSDIYIFDEPTRGIDVGSKSEIYKIINSLTADGAAVIVISSELPEILGICDRIVVMKDGRITGELSRAEATQEKIMSYALGGV